MRYLLWTLTFFNCLTAGPYDPILYFDVHGDGFKVALKESANITSVEVTPFIKESGWLEPYIISDKTRTVIATPLFQKATNELFTIVWQSLDAENIVHLEAAVYSTSNSWESAKILSESFEYLNPGVYALHLDKEGNPFVTWESSLEVSGADTYLRTSFLIQNNWTSPTTLRIN